MEKCSIFSMVKCTKFVFSTTCFFRYVYEIWNLEGTHVLRIYVKRCVLYLPPPWFLMNCSIFNLFLAAAWCTAARPFESLTSRRAGSATKRRLKSSKLPLSAAWKICFKRFHYHFNLSFYHNANITFVYMISDKNRYRKKNIYINTL